MSAGQHLQSEQLRMFIPAGELKSLRPNPYDEEQFHDEHLAEFHRENDIHPAYDPFGTKHGWVPPSRQEFWEKRSEEAKESGLQESVKREGVKTPVTLYHGAPRGEFFTDSYNVEPKTIIANGHHRIAAAIDTRGSDELLPVEHFAAKESSFTQAVRAQESD